MPNALLVVPIPQRVPGLAAGAGACRKEGGLMRPVIAILIAVLLSGCHKDQPGGKAPKSVEEQRIEKEVVRRVEMAGTAAKARQSTLHTVRMVGFLLLAGG